MIFPFDREFQPLPGGSPVPREILLPSATGLIVLDAVSNRVSHRALTTGPVNYGAGTTAVDNIGDYTFTEDCLVPWIDPAILMDDGATMEAQMNVGWGTTWANTEAIFPAFYVHKHSDAPYRDHEIAALPLPYLFRSGQTIHAAGVVVNNGAAANLSFVFMFGLIPVAQLTKLPVYEYSSARHG